MLHTTVLFAAFPRPPILLTALPWTLRADLPSPWNTGSQTKGRVSSSLISTMQDGYAMCLAGHVPAYVLHRDICFLATLSICIQLVICRRIQIFLCHLTEVIVVPCCVSSHTGCGEGMYHREDTDFLNPRWMIARSWNRVTMKAVIVTAASAAAQLGAVFPWNGSAGVTQSFLREGCLSVRALWGRKHTYTRLFWDATFPPLQANGRRNRNPKTHRTFPLRNMRFLLLPSTCFLGLL